MCGAQRWVSPHVGSVDSANGCFVHGPWSVGRSRVSEIQLVERARRLGVRDADEMPCARLVADDRVVVDVPALVFAGRGVVDPLELADRKITRHS